ncbi:MAG: hypothetical protein KA191_03260 [Verrucomicrobia bacterium]|nr:hypothetical protein [Verrucomicrobiota bacterium]
MAVLSFELLGFRFDLRLDQIDCNADERAGRLGWEPTGSPVAPMQLQHHFANDVVLASVGDAAGVASCCETRDECD